MNRQIAGLVATVCVILGFVVYAKASGDARRAERAALLAVETFEPGEREAMVAFVRGQLREMIRPAPARGYVRVVSWPSDTAAIVPLHPHRLVCDMFIGLSIEFGPTEDTTFVQLTGDTDAEPRLSAPWDSVAGKRLGGELCDMVSAYLSAL